MLKCGMHSLVLGGCQSQCPLLCLSSKVMIGAAKNTHFPFIELNPLTITPYSNSQQRHTRSCWIGLAILARDLPIVQTCPGSINGIPPCWCNRAIASLLISLRPSRNSLRCFSLGRSLGCSRPLGGTQVAPGDGSNDMMIHTNIMNIYTKISYT